ncbi:MAG: DegT/DnrJ/EryC1/StrS family aminotransferase [Thiobacillaceae bacterium]
MLPVSQPKLSQREIDYVTDAVKSGWVSSLGEYIGAFERGFADFCGTRYAVSVCNGTVGLHLALKVLGIGEGDEVIVPDLTFVATANAVRLAQGTPIMVDVCRDTYCIDPAEIEQAITPRTRAIIPVHLYGHPANMPAIINIARDHNLYVIEDAAEAHGASIKDVRVGGFGDCGVFSFYGNKIITSGEGGMITTNDFDLYSKAQLLRDHAMSKDVRYWHTEVGYNYRITNLQAALGLAQLEQIGDFLKFRSDLLQLYKDKLEPAGIECNPSVNATPVNWMVCAVVERLDREKRDQVIARMRDLGVDARPFFYPMSMMPMYTTRNNPIAYKLSECGFNLPTFVGMTEGQVSKACSAFLLALDQDN